MLEIAETIVFVMLESWIRSNYLFCRANNLVTASGRTTPPTPLGACLKHILAQVSAKPEEKRESSNPSVTSSVEEGREESLISKRRGLSTPTEVGGFHSMTIYHLTHSDCSTSHPSGNLVDGLPLVVNLSAPNDHARTQNRCAGARYTWCEALSSGGEKLKFRGATQT